MGEYKVCRSSAAFWISRDTLRAQAFIDLLRLWVCSFGLRNGVGGLYWGGVRSKILDRVKYSFFVRFREFTLALGNFLVHLHLYENGQLWALVLIEIEPMLSTMSLKNLCLVLRETSWAETSIRILRRGYRNVAITKETEGNWQDGVYGMKKIKAYWENVPSSSLSGNGLVHASNI